ncbi:hypothetical protein BGZ99_001445 [Dissophora globulifera]|uniref:Uncharacterized protein n=1 Tax=Dissophora globulifera TaxID=979702 RepID=A0A9P6UXT4_9FUNG|nr:hypothetical protein BGZ99_001445 [Dissophora globulifera]
MTPHCVVDPMECIYGIRSVRWERRTLPPPLPPPLVSAPSNGMSGASTSTIVSSEKILIISVAVLSTLLLLTALTLFFVCMKRRSANRRINQIQDFSSTFIDEKAIDISLKKQAIAISSASTLVPPPSNVHHRTRSAPVAFAQGSFKDRGRSDNDSQLHLTEDTYAESEDEIVLKRSLSSDSKYRVSTVSPQTSLCRGVSLNNHGTSGYISRSAPIDEEEGGQDHPDSDALPTPANIRYTDAEVFSRLSFSQEHSSASRFTPGTGYPAHRRSISSPMEFDPSQFPITANLFDFKRRQTGNGDGADSSDESDDDTASTLSSDGFNHLPAHQMHQNFEAHDPYSGCGDGTSMDENSIRDLRLVGGRGAPRHLQSQHGVTYTAPTMPAPTRLVEGIAFRRNAPLLPSRIMLPRMHGKQSASSADDIVDLDE